MLTAAQISDVRPHPLLCRVQAVVKGAKKQKVAPEDFNTLPADQWPVRPYLEKYVAPLLMQAMQARTGACSGSDVGSSCGSVIRYIRASLSMFDKKLPRSFVCPGPRGGA